MGTREDILRCARDIYVDGGLQLLSMRAVAGCVGVTPTAIYRHFDSKEDLLLAVAQEGDQLFEKYLLRGLAGSTPRERLDLTGEGYLDFALDHPHYYKVLFLAPKSDFGLAKLADRVGPNHAPTFQLLIDRVRECVDSGILRAGELRLLAFDIWAHCHGIIALYLVGRNGFFPSPEAFRSFYLTSVRRHVDGLVS